MRIVPRASAGSDRAYADALTEVRRIQAPQSWSSITLKVSGVEVIGFWHNQPFPL